MLSCGMRKAHPRVLVSGLGTRLAEFPDQKPDPEGGLFSSHMTNIWLIVFLPFLGTFLEIPRNHEIVNFIEFEK